MSGPTSGHWSRRGSISLTNRWMAPSPSLAPWGHRYPGDASTVTTEPHTEQTKNTGGSNDTSDTVPIGSRRADLYGGVVYGRVARYTGATRRGDRTLLAIKCLDPIWRPTILRETAQPLYREAGICIVVRGGSRVRHSIHGCTSLPTQVRGFRGARLRRGRSRSIRRTRSSRDIDRCRIDGLPLGGA